MTQYCNYVNGEVKFIGNLPHSVGNIAAFHLTSQEVINANNWYEFEEEALELLDYEKVTEEQFVLENNIVTKKYLKGNMSLDDYKIKKTNEMVNSFNLAHFDGFTCSNNIKLDCRESDETSWLAVITKANLGHNVNIKDFNNNIHNISSSDAIEMMLEILEHYEALLGKLWSLKAQIQEKTSHEELSLVRW